MVKNGTILEWKNCQHYLEVQHQIIRKTYWLNCFCSYSTKDKLKKHYNVCKHFDYCYVEMFKEDKILKYNHGEKSIKVPFIIYADVESLLEKMSTYHNNTEKSSTIKINEHTPSGYSLLTHCSFDLTKNKLVIEVKTVWKGFKRACNKNNQLWKKKKRNDTTNWWRK